MWSEDLVREAGPSRRRYRDRLAIRRILCNGDVTSKLSVVQALSSRPPRARRRGFARTLIHRLGEREPAVQLAGFSVDPFLITNRVIH